MKALIVVNAYIKNKSQISQAERIRQELVALDIDARVEKNFNLANIKDGKVSRSDYGFCVYLDKDKAAARLLEKSGLRLFNSAEAVEVCDNKMLTHIALADQCINMPDCVYAPLCYYSDAKADLSFLKRVESELGFPLVAKTSYGSLGAGVTLIKSFDELVSYENARLTEEHFYQQFIDCGCGEDIRVIVIGGKYVCSMKRSNKSDFRSNIELGGAGEKCDADGRLISLAERVADSLGLDYCGIDVLTDKNGKRYICEVNSNAFFAAAEKACGVNIAKTYCEHMIKCLK